MTLFDCSHLTLVIANAKIHVTVQVFALLDFQFKGNFQVHAPGGLIFERRLTEGFFWRYEFRSLYLRGGGLFSEFYGIYHDEFFILIIYMCVISCTYIFITMAKLMKNAIHSP